MKLSAVQLPAVGAPGRDGCRKEEVSVVICSSLFRNVTDHHISLAWSLGAFEMTLIKTEAEGPGEPSDEK